MSGLDGRLLAAHAAEDGTALVALYAEAARGAAAATARGFFLTQAYVFALEAGDPHADALRAELIAMGREPAR